MEGVITLPIQQNTIVDQAHGPPPTLLDDLCTPPTIASLLGVSPPTVYSAIRKNQNGLAHLRTPGGQIRVRRRDVLAYCHQNGLEVPMGLIPPKPDLVVIHPNHRISNRLRVILEPKYKLRVLHDIVDGLLAIGELKPPLILVSHLCGDTFLDRLCYSVSNITDIGYMAIISFTDDGEGLNGSQWNGGIVPLPITLMEPTNAQSSDLCPLIDRLLGFE